ncbi:MAG: hypothetical protein NZ932_00760 [Candidatus Bathyarchaeota archaeon]|nr:hypothetical protein [Candidatus Bathyarchaeota archaeon]
MSLDLMESRGIKLPPRETDVSGLTDVKVIDKVRGFWERYNRESSADNEFAPMDFLEILAAYPVSMCSFHMTDSLKLLVALMYFYSKPSEEEIKRQIESNKKLGIKIPVYEGLSMDYLALVFDRSKKTIHDAIKEKEAEAKKLIEEAKLRKEAREIALRELVEEEKQKIKSVK